MHLNYPLFIICFKDDEDQTELAGEGDYYAHLGWSSDEEEAAEAGTSMDVSEPANPSSMYTMQFDSLTDQIEEVQTQIQFKLT